MRIHVTDFLRKFEVSFKLLIFGLLLLPLLLQAQLSGTYTIGSGGTYASFGAAVTALNTQGVNGAVTFNVLSGTYTEQIEINAFSGSSASNTVTFKSQTNNASDVTLQFSQTSGANYIVRFNGADYVTFQQMTLTGLSNSYGRIFVLGENADNNRVTGCIINGYPITYVSDQFTGVYGSFSSSNSDGLIISNNTFNDISVGVALQGVASNNLASGTQVLNNTFNDVRRGIYLGNQLAPVVSGNTITALNDRGIELNYANGALVIT
ncbi:MAG: right-handed parallel beta-helix repeat-containing protein, partial [bacterium]